MPDGRPTTTLTRDAARRVDSKLENGLTGMGIPGVDVNESTKRRYRTFTIQDARLEYRTSFAAKREIDGPAGDIVARGVEISAPESVDVDAVAAYAADVGADGVLPEDRGVLQALSKIYGASMKLGGALGVMVIEDGLDPWEPVDLTRVQDLLAIEVLERDEVTPWSPDATARPEFYILGGFGGQVEAGQIVHRSRVIVGVGDRLGPRAELLNQGWGASRLELLMDERTAMHAAFQELASMMLKSNFDVVFFAELAEMMCETKDAGGDTGTVNIEERMSLLARGRSQHKLYALDAGREANPKTQEPGRPADQLTSVARVLRGAQDLAISLAEHWAGGTGQTPSIALGIQAGGLNTGANTGDARSYDGLIDGIQTTWLEPRHRIVMDVIFAAKNGPTRGRVPSSYTLTYPRLWRPTEQENADTAKSWAEVDAAYVAMAPATAPAIVEQRLVQGETGPIRLDPEPDVDPNADPGEPDLEVEEEQDEIEAMWSDAQPPADAGTSSELAAHDDLTGKVTAHGITRMARDGELTVYKDIRRGQPVPVYSLRDVKTALLKRGGELVDEEPTRRDRFRAWIRRSR